MEPKLRGIEWETLEHHHEPKGNDWFWVLGILTICGAVAAVVFENMLLGLLILIGGAVAGILAKRPPKMVNYAINQRGVRIDNAFYPYTTLDHYFIDDHPLHGHQLLIKSQKLFMPLLILPLPDDTDDIEGIEALIAERIPEEHIEEPFANHLLEFFRF